MPWPCRGPPCHRGKKAQDAASPWGQWRVCVFRGHRGRRGPRGEDSVSLCFLEVEQDTSALLQMDVVRAAEDRASQQISCKERATPILLKAGRQHKDSNWPSGHVSHSMHGESYPDGYSQNRRGVGCPAWRLMRGANGPTWTWSPLVAFATMTSQKEPADHVTGWSKSNLLQKGLLSVM